MPCLEYVKLMRERAYLEDRLILGRVKDKWVVYLRERRERRALNQVNFEGVVVLVERTKSNESRRRKDIFLGRIPVAIR
jgi:hypothetical protein